MLICRNLGYLVDLSEKKVLIENLPEEIPVSQRSIWCVGEPRSGTLDRDIPVVGAILDKKVTALVCILGILGLYGSLGMSFCSRFVVQNFVLSMGAQADIIASSTFFSVIMGYKTMAKLAEMYFKSRLTSFYRAIDREKHRLDLISRHVHKVQKTPNSCYTWAEEKLLLIDVKMPTGFLDRFIAVSTLYVDQKF